MLKEKLKRLAVLFHFDNSIQLLISRIFFSKHGALFYRLRGLEVLVDHSAGDQDGTRSCLYPGLYTPCIDAIPDLQKTLSVLDLGANGGGFLLSLELAGFKIEQAVLVELNPNTWSRCVLNIYRNIEDASNRVLILNGAASGEDGTLTIQLGRGSVGDSIVNASTEGNTYHLKKYSFPTLIGNFSENDIDICKIDIEGSEYEFFDAIARDEIRRCRNIIIEIHEVEGRSSQALKSLILDHGYREIIPKTKMVEDNVFLFSRVN